VNIASRLQTLAEPDTICISDVVYRDVAQKIPLGTVISLGRPKLKNIAQRFPVYALLPEAPRGVRQTLQSQRLKLSRRRGRVVVVSVSILLLGAIVAVRYFRLPTLITHHSSLEEAQPPLLPLPDKPSIVVLPFVNMSQDPEQDYFSDGITEDITADLSRISSLFVIARNSAFTYKDKAAKAQDIRKELGVRYVLEGSVRKANDQVRITAQLIDATTGEHLWSQRYDRSLKDIFALQDEIVQKIVTTLKLQLTVREQGWIVRKHTDNLEAYDYFLRGIESSNRLTKEANTQARQMFEKAIALDPQYAEAYAWLGWTYYIEWSWQWSQDPQALEQAVALAQKAIALDDSLPIAHSYLSFCYARKQQYDQAIAEGEQAIALDPNNADSYAVQAGVLNFAGRPAEALGSMEQVMQLNPHYPAGALIQVSWAYQLMGQYVEAIAVVKQLLARNPNHLVAHFNLGVSYLSQWAFQLSQDPQTLERAREAAQRAIALNDTFPGGHALLGYVSLYQKQYERAIAEIERAVALAPNDAGNYASLADVLSRAGRVEDALGAAEKALHLQSSGAVDQHLNFIGSAYYLAGRPEEAIASLQRFLSHYPNILGAHLTLAAVYTELGKEAEARAEAVEVLRINPKFSPEVHKQRVPIKDPAVLERQLAALRKAGLK